MKTAVKAGIVSILMTGAALATDVRLHVIPLSNSDGTHSYAVTSQQFASLVDRVNAVYAGTSIKFVFNPTTDWAPMADTDLNSDGADMRTRGNQIASTHPGKLVCFLRWGSQASRTGNGNAYPPPGAYPKSPDVTDFEQDYVALPNQIESYSGAYDYLNQGNGSFVAHELGHYLGLYHTFPDWTDRCGVVYAGIPGCDSTQYPNGPPIPTAAQADQAVIDFIVARAGTVNALDGDALSDTAPDPSPVLYAAHGQNICLQPAITVKGTNKTNGKSVSFTLSPDAGNVMSYFASCVNPPAPQHFSPQQIQRMNDVLNFTLRRSLAKGSAPEGPATVITPNGKIHIFARGDDYNISHAICSASSCGAFQTDPGAGVFTSGPAAAVTPTGEIHLFGVGVDRNIWHNYWNGSSWTGYRTDLGTGSTFTSRPAALVTSNGYVHVFATGDDRAMWHNVWNGSVWSGWKADTGAGTFTSGPAVVCNSSGQIHLFAVGTDRNLWHNFLNGTVWSTWKADTGFASLTSNPAAVVTPDGLMHVFARGDDGNMWQSYWNGSSWSGWKANLASGSFASGPAAATTPTGMIQAFALGADRNVWHSTWNGTVWSAWKADIGAKPFQP